MSVNTSGINNSKIQLKCLCSFTKHPANNANKCNSFSIKMNSLLIGWNLKRKVANWMQSYLIVVAKQLRYFNLLVSKCMEMLNSEIQWWHPLTSATRISMKFSFQLALIPTSMSDIVALVGCNCKRYFSVFYYTIKMGLKFHIFLKVNAFTLSWWSNKRITAVWVPFRIVVAFIRICRNDK